jgi:hypothetical protein
VDCIVLEPTPALPEPDLSRERFAFHTFRLERGERERTERLDRLE